MSKELATIQVDVPVEIDVGSAPPRSPTGRDPRDVPDLRAARPAAAPRGGARASRAGARRAVRDHVETRACRSPRPACRSDGELAALAAQAAAAGGAGAGRAAPRRARAAAVRRVRGRGRDVGEAETLAAVTMGWGERALVAHDWKSIAAPGGAVPGTPLEHDTRCRLPARPGRPRVSARRAARERGHRRLGEGRGRPRGGRREHARAGRAAGQRIEELGLTRLLREVELPLVDVLIEMERRA